jgi:hypothetical protein
VLVVASWVLALREGSKVLGRRLVFGLGADLCRMTEVVLFLSVSG